MLTNKREFNSKKNKTVISTTNFQIYENNSSLPCGNPEQIKHKIHHLANVIINLPLQTFGISLP
jgi:hypothetical protein